MLDVPEEDVHAGDDECNARRQRDEGQTEREDQPDRRTGLWKERHVERDEHEEHDQEGDQMRRSRREGDKLTREPHPLYEGRAEQQTAGRRLERGREENPWSESR